MRFFIGGHIDVEVEAFSRVQRDVQAGLDKAVAGRDYGTAVELIGVFPTISRRLRGYERRLFQRSKHEADYRLVIPYEKFQRSSTRGREILLVEIVLAAVADIDRKAKAARLNFDGTQLAIDIRRRFKLPAQPESTSRTDRRTTSTAKQSPSGARAGGGAVKIAARKNVR